MAAKMDGQIDEEVKDSAARDQMMELQAEHQAKSEAEKVGKTWMCSATAWTMRPAVPAAHHRRLPGDGRQRLTPARYPAVPRRVL